MPKSNKDNKVQKYREALELFDQNTGLTWNQCCRQVGSTDKYVFIPECDRDYKVLDVVSACCNYIDNRDGVGLAFNEKIMNKYGLIGKDTISTPMEKIFKLGDFSDGELLDELKRRGIMMENVRRRRQVISYEEEQIEY